MIVQKMSDGSYRVKQKDNIPELNKKLGKLIPNTDQDLRNAVGNVFPLISFKTFKKGKEEVYKQMYKKALISYNNLTKKEPKSIGIINSIKKELKSIMNKQGINV